MNQRDELPVAVIGAGPVGLAAAAHLIERQVPTVVLEAGDAVAASVREWGHVRLFSPWRYNVDGAAARLLDATGWERPDDDRRPTGAELISDYLDPLAALPPVSVALRLSRHVTGISRFGADKLRGLDREAAPFVVVADTPHGSERLLARAVIDATGSWSSHNPIGAEGLPADGERRLDHRIRYGIPDVRGAERARYEGRVTAVVGSGHSAQNVVRDLAALAELVPGTAVHWVVRREGEGQMFGGGDADALPARGQLGSDAKALVTSGATVFETGFRVNRITTEGDRLWLHDASGRSIGPVDQVVAATGARPDLTFLRELRIDLDPVVESTRDLAPLIDPNVHSCGSVPAHGYKQLAHSEPNFYVVGAKSYGRAPTFLLATGYEQVRSVVAALAGDFAAAEDVQLDLPETGVCMTDTAAGGGGACCGAPSATTVGPQTSSCGPPPAPPAAVVTEPDGCCDAPPVEAARPVAAGCCG